MVQVCWWGNHLVFVDMKMSLFLPLFLKVFFFLPDTEFQIERVFFFFFQYLKICSTEFPFAEFRNKKSAIFLIYSSVDAFKTLLLILRNVIIIYHGIVFMFLGLGFVELLDEVCFHQI